MRFLIYDLRFDGNEVASPKMPAALNRRRRFGFEIKSQFINRKS
jgi:hypothetical protein